MTSPSFTAWSVVLMQRRAESLMKGPPEINTRRIQRIHESPLGAQTIGEISRRSHAMGLQSAAARAINQAPAQDREFIKLLVDIWNN